MGWTATPLAPDDDAFWSDWDELARSSPIAHPLIDARYVRLALNAFGHDGGQPWGVRLHGARGCEVIALMRRRPVGCWQSLRHAVLPVATLLARPGALRKATVQQLFSALPGIPWLLRLYDCDPAFNPPVLDSTRHGVRLSDHETVTIDTVGDFDAYWSTRSRRLRSNVNGSLRKLAAEGGVALVCVSERSEMARAVAQHAMLEASGWKGRQGSAMSPEGRYGRFYRSVLETFAGSNEARAYQLWHGQQLIASQLCTLTRGTIATMKTAYLESAAAYSPGRVLDHLMLRDLFADPAVERVEYCVNASRFDLQWATQTRLLSQIDVPRKAWLGGLLRQARRLRRARSLPPPAATTAGP